MGRNVGIWLDYSECIVAFPDEGNLSRRIASRAGRNRPASGKQEQDPNALERLRKYYQEIISCVHSASSILVCGPDDAKLELLEIMLSMGLRENVCAMEVQAKLSTSDFVELVRDKFAAGALNAAVATAK
jgi:hypothetical protein